MNVFKVAKEAKISRIITPFAGNIFFFNCFLIIPFIYLLLFRDTESLSVSNMLLAGLLVAMLLTSLVNIPVMGFRTKRPIMSENEIRLIERTYGIKNDRAFMRSSVYDSILTLNVGGFIIPAIIVAVFASEVSLPTLFILTSLMIIATHLLSRIEPGVGIIVPTYLCILVFPFALILLKDGVFPTLIVSGILGFELGAISRMMAVDKTKGCSAYSIGGTGNFNAVFLVVLISVLSLYF